MTETVRAIRESEYEECLDLWQTVWPEDERAYFARYFYGDQDFQPEYTRVCEIDGLIVSVAHIVKRIVSCGDLKLTMGGIANVVTLPKFRRRGYSAKCLRQAVQVMEADAMDFSLLFSGAHALYSGLGWESVGSEECVVKLPPQLDARPTNLSLRPYISGDDEALHGIYRSFNDSRPITVMRSAPYWRDWLGWWRGNAPGQAVIAERDGKLSGYILYSLYSGSRSAPMASIQELGALEGSEDALDPLIEQAARHALDQGIRKLRAPLARHPAVRETLSRIGKVATDESDDHVMARFFQGDNLLRGLAPELTMRWIQAGSPPGGLSFRGPGGVARIASDGGFLHISAVDSPGRSLKQSDLFNLLVGRRHLVTDLPQADRDFAAALFPIRDAWFWEMDAF